MTGINEHYLADFSRSGRNLSIATGRFDDFTKAMFDAGKSAVEVCIYLLGIVSLWLGLTKILERVRPHI